MLIEIIYILQKMGDYTMLKSITLIGLLLTAQSLFADDVAAHVFLNSYGSGYSGFNFGKDEVTGDGSKCGLVFKGLTAFYASDLSVSERQRWSSFSVDEFNRGQLFPNSFSNPWIVAKKTNLYGEQVELRISYQSSSKNPFGFDQYINNELVDHCNITGQLDNSLLPQ